MQNANELKTEKKIEYCRLIRQNVSTAEIRWAKKNAAHFVYQISQIFGW